MIKIENAQVVGWEPTIRGMRNPMNSWEKSDSIFHEQALTHVEDEEGNIKEQFVQFDALYLGENDLDLSNRLANGGPVHAKYRRMIVVYLDIVAPLYWWKEFDTYKVGTVANSCSTMHKIHEKEFTLDDFSREHLERLPRPFINNYEANYNYDVYLESTDLLDHIIRTLNTARNMYLETKDKKYWWQMIQLLPSSYNQRRTVMLNYEVLANIYKWRKNHKLDEWKDFCKWIETLPYSELIVGDTENK